MKYQEKQIYLKDKTTCILRTPREEEAEEMLSYFKGTSEESHFMINYPEEIQMTIEEERDFLKKGLDSETDIRIAVFKGEEIIGCATIYSYSDRLKMKHRACFGIAIRERFQGRGLGDILTREAIEAAGSLGYTQVELGVFSDNEKALNLYRKYGFEEWGRTKNAFHLKDGTYRDEIVMGLMLGKS